MLDSSCFKNEISTTVCITKLFSLLRSQLENKVLPTPPIFSLMHRGSGLQIEVIEPVYQIIAQIFPTHQTAVLPMPD